MSIQLHKRLPGEFIEGVLEEREREVFFVQKILKSRLLGERV